MDVYLRIIRGTKYVLVAACDNDLLGKCFREGKMKLEVSRDFYGTKLSSLEKTVQIVRDADVANLVGRKVVEAAVRRGLVDREAVILIAGIPHVQVMKL